MTIEPHEAVAPLAFLLGTWTGRGRGAYPTIEPFEYEETVVFEHVGKPFLAYRQRTARVPDGFPLHAEAGYLRPAGAGAVELVIAQPSGIAEIQVGSFVRADDGGVLDLHSHVVALTPTAKRVDQVRRHFEVHGGVLRYVLDMAAVGQELQFHLDAELHRTS